MKFGPPRLIQCTQGTFGSQVLTVILESLGAFPIFDNFVLKNDRS